MRSASGHARMRTALPFRLSVATLQHCSTAAAQHRWPPAHASDTGAQTLGTVSAVCCPFLPSTGSVRLAASITLLLLLLASLPAAQATPFPRRLLAVAQQGRNATASAFASTGLPGSATSLAQASASSFAQASATSIVAVGQSGAVSLCQARISGGSSL